MFFDIEIQEVTVSQSFFSLNWHMVNHVIHRSLSKCAVVQNRYRLFGVTQLGFIEHITNLSFGRFKICCLLFKSVLLTKSLAFGRKYWPNSVTVHLCPRDLVRSNPGSISEE